MARLSLWFTLSKAAEVSSPLTGIGDASEFLFLTLAIPPFHTISHLLPETDPGILTLETLSRFIGPNGRYSAVRRLRAAVVVAVAVVSRGTSTWLPMRWN